MPLWAGASTRTRARGLVAQPLAHADQLDLERQGKAGQGVVGVQGGVFLVHVHDEGGNFVPFWRTQDELLSDRDLDFGGKEVLGTRMTISSLWGP